MTHEQKQDLLVKEIVNQAIKTMRETIRINKSILADKNWAATGSVEDVRAREDLKQEIKVFINRINILEK